METAGRTVFTNHAYGNGVNCRVDRKGIFRSACQKSPPRPLTTWSTRHYGEGRKSQYISRTFPNPLPHFGEEAQYDLEEDSVIGTCPMTYDGYDPCEAVPDGNASTGVSGLLEIASDFNAEFGKLWSRDLDMAQYDVRIHLVLEKIGRNRLLAYLEDEADFLELYLLMPFALVFVEHHDKDSGVLEAFDRGLRRTGNHAHSKSLCKMLVAVRDCLEGSRCAECYPQYPKLLTNRRWMELPWTERYGCAADIIPMITTTNFQFEVFDIGRCVTSISAVVGLSAGKQVPVQELVDFLTSKEAEEMVLLSKTLVHAMWRFGYAENEAGETLWRMLDSRFRAESVVLDKLMDATLADLESFREYHRTNALFDQLLGE